MDAWSLGAGYGRERREIRLGDEARRLEAWRAMALARYQALDWLAFEGGLGAGRGSLDGEDGEAGVVWQVGCRAGLAEWVLDRSPVLGRKRAVRVEALAWRRGTDSNRGEAEFGWNEWALEPRAVYGVNRQGPERWHPYEPEAVRVFAGAVLSRVDGKLGSQNIRENRSFGLSTGLELNLSKRWIIGLEGRSFLEGGVADVAAYLRVEL